MRINKRWLKGYANRGNKTKKHILRSLLPNDDTEERYTLHKSMVDVAISLVLLPFIYGIWRLPNSMPKDPILVAVTVLLMFSIPLGLIIWMGISIANISNKGRWQYRLLSIVTFLLLVIISSSLIIPRMVIQINSQPATNITV